MGTQENAMDSEVCAAGENKAGPPRVTLEASPSLHTLPSESSKIPAEPRPPPQACKHCSCLG